MDQIASLDFRDAEAGCSGFASVRVARQVVALALSLETDGDLEASFTPQVARALAAALERAAKQAEGT